MRKGYCRECPKRPGCLSPCKIVAAELKAKEKPKRKHGRPTLVLASEMTNNSYDFVAYGSKRDYGTGRRDD